MQEVTKYTPGTFSWVDLQTTDAEGAKKFYTELFGWSAMDIPMGEGAVYTMLTLEGRDVAALSQMSPEQQQQGMPPMWNSYVTVENADKSAAKAKSLGGTVLMEAFDVMEAGRMAVIQDPSGGVLSAWQPKNHIGAKFVNVPGSLTWNELATHDTAGAEEFYKGLFGWEAQTNDMGGGMMYTAFTNKGRMNGGMFPMPKEMDGIPPHWITYFAVSDCDATIQKIQSLGGKVMMGPHDIPQTGRFAMVQDPQGGTFAVIKLDNADGPPPA